MMIKFLISDKSLLLVIAIAAAIWLWTFSGILLTPVSVLDDAFIVLFNAETFSGLRQPSVFVEQGSFTGSTSFLHTLLLVFMLQSGLPGEVVLALSTLVFCLFYLVGAVMLIDTFAVSRSLKIVFLFLSFFMGVIPNQLTNGLETGLAMAFVMWVIYSYIVGGIVKKWLLPLLLGLMPLVRPELIVLSGLIFLAWLYDDFKAGKSVKDLVVMVVHVVTLSMVVALPLLLVLYNDTGGLFPSSVMAKKYFFAEGCESFIEKGRLFFQAIAVFIGPLFLAVLFIPYLRKNTLGLALLLFSIIFLMAYWLNAPGLLSHYSGRYCYLFAPVIFYAVLMYVEQYKSNSKKMVLFYCLLVQVLLFNVFLNGFMFQQRITFMKNNHRANTHWLKEHTQAGDTLLVHDVGYVGYMLQDRHIIDMVGLKTPEIIPIHRDITWASCGKNRGLAIAEIVRQYRPDYVMVFSWWNDDFQLTSKLAEVASLETVKNYNLYTNGGYIVYHLHYEVF